MQRIKMIIQYDGSQYHGFQIQLNAHTIQAALQEAIYRLTAEKVSVLFAGRTDTGVHALGQVIAFDTSASIPAQRWGLALNSFLPPDIQVLESEAARADFHPRFLAVTKHYRYRIYRSPLGAVCQRNYAWCNTEKLDLEKMQRACAYLRGTHNFKSFCASGSPVKTFTRTVSRCQMEEDDHYLFLDIAADGFLYNMVRIITGTLIEVGRGRLKAQNLAEILARQDRRYAGPTAPPQGLYLLGVDY
ncbi:MAG TPA: tRNA pseudouridine(38-40) synthase TruA [Syntrophomonas sp.]|nr:tRNA pseudouridine(38-40) synthase TruA [Syntrophomonas sp.]